jgi:galactokinase
VLIAAIFNILYNQSRFAAEELAQIGQFAENNYFGKPCGLMDQMTCAVGGVVAIDFRNPQQPRLHGWKRIWQLPVSAWSWWTAAGITPI